MLARSMVCKDSQSRVTLAAVTRVDRQDSEHAEVDVILLVLKLAADIRDTPCIIVNDVKSLVHWIWNKDLVPSCRVAHLLNECCNVLETNTKARLEFSIRSSNEAAHCVVRRGVIGSDTDWILPLPYPYPHPTFGYGYGYGYGYWRMWKNDIHIRQNRISDINRILADRMRILIGYIKNGYG